MVFWTQVPDCGGDTLSNFDDDDDDNDASLTSVCKLSLLLSSGIQMREK